MLYRSNKLMYDRATETLWHQFRGEPVVGPLAGSGIRLEILPNVLTTWGEWLDLHPDTTVITNNTGIYPAEFYRPEEDTRSIYYSYRADRDTMFPVGIRDEGLAVKDQVFGLTFDDVARAYPRTALALVPVLNDTVGGQDLVVITGSEGGSRAYSRNGQTFEYQSDELILDDGGKTWRVLEDALENAADPTERLERLPSRDAFWFGWYAFYPETELYSP